MSGPRLRAVPVEGGRVSVVFSTRPAIDGVITAVDEGCERFDVRDENDRIREFRLRPATGRFENVDGSWIRFQY